jgi:hypothetical protein
MMAVIHSVVSSLASGQDQDMLQTMAGKMGLAPDDVRQMAAVVASGAPASQLPAALLERVTSVHRAASLAGGAYQHGFPPNGDGPEQSSDDLGLLDEEEQQSWLLLYSRCGGGCSQRAHLPVRCCSPGRWWRPARCVCCACTGRT